MDITAELNYFRIAPRKVRLAAGLIRGKRVGEAERELQFLTKRASLPLLKLLKSAVANATHNFNLQKDNLYISKITVDGGSPLKRIRPRAFGRAFPIKKRTSHITLVLGEIKGSSAGKRKRPKKTGPVVSTAHEAPEGELEKKRFKEPLVGKLAPAKKPINVIRRVFQRKAV
ncbi:MAG: 50S ribosomal protein L22 [Candidatus Niyogibacteria bacterium]|nr:50S ribosomal protein L22 [Candidatus Niyogibacteria bacterium]